MLKYCKKIFIIICCCLLNYIYAGNSWDQFISVKSQGAKPSSKVAGTPKLEERTTNKQAPLLQKQDGIVDADDENNSSEDLFLDKAYSQWFDNDIRPQFCFRGGYIEQTQFGRYGATEIATLDLKLRLCNAMDFLPGATFDAWLFADGMYFLDDPGISALPDTLLAAGFDVGLWWRFANGFSWEFRGAPGIYSDPAAPEVSFTATVNLHYTWSEQLCLFTGFTYRHDWDMKLFPNIGLLWQPNDAFRMLLAMPETRIDILPRHIVNFYGILSWDNTTYWLDSDVPSIETITFDAVRASVGATITLFDEYEFSTEVGTHLHHELKGCIQNEKTIELEKSMFIKAFVGSRF